MLPELWSSHSQGEALLLKNCRTFRQKPTFPQVQGDYFISICLPSSAQWLLHPGLWGELATETNNKVGFK